MKPDASATRLARRRHSAGVKRLRDYFAVTQARIEAAGLQHGNAEPVRLHPNTPPVRDAEHQEKHRKRKAARASRRRNRA